MRWLALFAIIAGLACQSGCQNFGGGGYPVQSVTRVPPPATGSYPMGGSYYNAPTGTQSSVTPALDSSGFASNAQSNNAAGSIGSQATASPSSFVSQAQYTAVPSTTPSNTAIPNSIDAQPINQLPINQMPANQLPSNSPSMPNLQWQ